MRWRKFIEPEYRYHPGVNARPHGGPVHEIAAAAAAALSLDDQDVRTAWQYGLFLIDRRFFWEAHEVLEPVWMAALPNSRERHLVQGIIQLANACLKSDMGRPRAAGRLIEMACSHLAEAQAGDGDALLGVRVDGCIAQAEVVRRKIEDDRSFDGIVNLQNARK